MRLQKWASFGGFSSRPSEYIWRYIQDHKTMAIVTILLGTGKTEYC